MRGAFSQLTFLPLEGLLLMSSWPKTSRHNNPVYWGDLGQLLTLSGPASSLAPWVNLILQGRSTKPVEWTASSTIPGTQRRSGTVDLHLEWELHSVSCSDQLSYHLLWKEDTKRALCFWGGISDCKVCIPAFLLPVLESRGLCLYWTRPTEKPISQLGRKGSQHFQWGIEKRARVLFCVHIIFRVIRKS